RRAPRDPRGLDRIRRRASGVVDRRAQPDRVCDRPGAVLDGTHRTEPGLGGIEAVAAGRYEPGSSPMRSVHAIAACQLRRLQTELTEVMIGVEVRPPSPGRFGHRPEHWMLG